MCLCRRTRGSVRARPATMGLKYMTVSFTAEISGSDWRSLGPEDAPVELESPYMGMVYDCNVQCSEARMGDSSFRDNDAWGLYVYRPERWSNRVMAQAMFGWERSTYGVPRQADQPADGTMEEVLVLCELTGRQQDDASTQMRGEQIHLLAIVWSGEEVSEKQVRYLCSKYDLVDARV